LTARPVECSPEIILGSRCLRGRILQEDQFAFGAQQLGNLPEFFGTLGAGDRVVDGIKCVSDLPGFPKPLAI